MAHTLKGNMTGRAAAEHRRDRKEEFHSIGTRVDLSGIRARLKQKEKEARARCIALEDEKTFLSWYASVDGSISKRVELIEARIEELEAEKRYTIVESLLGGEEVNVLKIQDTAELIKLDGRPRS